MWRRTGIVRVTENGVLSTVSGIRIRDTEDTEDTGYGYDTVEKKSKKIQNARPWRYYSSNSQSGARAAMWASAARRAVPLWHGALAARSLLSFQPQTLPIAPLSISRSSPPAALSAFISSSPPPPGRQPWTTWAVGLAASVALAAAATPPCKAMDAEQPLEAQQFVKGAAGKGAKSHVWTCKWCHHGVTASSITKLRHHLLGTSSDVKKCTSTAPALIAVRDKLRGVQQQQLDAAAVKATAAAAATATAGPTPAGRQGGLTQTSMRTGL